MPSFQARQGCKALSSYLVLIRNFERKFLLHEWQNAIEGRSCHVSISFAKAKTLYLPIWLCRGFGRTLFNNNAHKILAADIEGFDRRGDCSLQGASRNKCTPRRVCLLTEKWHCNLAKSCSRTIFNLTGIELNANTELRPQSEAMGRV